MGAKSADRIWNAFQRRILPLRRRPDFLAAALRKITSAVPKKTAVAWAQLADTIAQLEARRPGNSASNMIQLVMEAGYEDYLKEQYPNYRSRREDLEQLASFALQFQTVEEFLTQLALQTTIEAEDTSAARRDDEKSASRPFIRPKAWSSTWSSSSCFATACFPSARSLENPEGEEEERRLFYVAITRARDELYLSYPLMRFTAGSGEMMQHPARF